MADQPEKETPQRATTAGQYEADTKKFVHDRKLEAKRDYDQQQANGTLGDPTARRHIGANGYTQRTGQKDQLEHLHIGGTETTPQGGNDHETAGENAAGPGFEVEGSYQMGNDIRTRDQEFGEKTTSGPANPAHD